MRVEVIQVRDLSLDLLSKLEKGTPLSWWVVVCSNAIQSVWQLKQDAEQDAAAVEGWLK